MDAALERTDLTLFATSTQSLARRPAPEDGVEEVVAVDHDDDDDDDDDGDNDDDDDNYDDDDDDGDRDMELDDDEDVNIDDEQLEDEVSRCISCDAVWVVPDSPLRL